MELALRALLLVCFPPAINGGHVAFELEAMNSDDLQCYIILLAEVVWLG
jgi:hypothetical protein